MFRISQNILLLFTGSMISVAALFIYAHRSKSVSAPSVKSLKDPFESKNTSSSAIVPSVPADTSKKEKRDKRRPNFNPKDRYGDPFSNRTTRTPLVLPNPSNVKTEVTMDSVNGTYTIQEKVGDMNYRPPTNMTFDEYMNYQHHNMIRSYWKDKNATESPLQNKSANHMSLKIPTPGLGSIFGKDYVEIKPNGSVRLDFGGQWQRSRNPSIPVRQQRTGGFNFDQQISLNIIGAIGDKLKLTANWDTKASFNFQNNLKLAYTGYEEDIIQKIEAGNVSFPVNSTLIQGSQNLFGVKAKLKFGRLSVTSVLASQRGTQQQITISGGSQSRTFEIRCDQYDDYRHFFLAHFFRRNYENSLKKLPTVFSGVKVTRVDVYVTNTSNSTSNNRAVLALLDLGESDSNMYHKDFHVSEGLFPPQNDTLQKFNKEYNTMRGLVDAGVGAPLVTQLNGMGLQEGTDYVVVNNARKLSANEYSFDPDLGYISLNTQVRLNDVLAVAFQYTYGDKTYTVGDIPGNTNQDSSSTMPLILKMLKPNDVNTSLPSWDLMMKNIYQLGASQLSRKNFQLNVIYKNDQTGADLPFLQQGKHTDKVLLLRLTGLDRLGPNNDPPGDGNFDYIEGVTVDSKKGYIIFPVLEPFGSDLRKHFDNDEQALINKYVFQELYDSTKSGTMNFASKDKYFLKGKYQAGSGSDIMLPGINIAHGSVVVMAGSNKLIEGTDYSIDYNLGRLKILNTGILESGQPITVRFEKTDLFNFRRKSFMGTRLDYKVGKTFDIGATVLHQTEAPQITRVSIGDEPSSNTLAGVDLSYNKTSRFITKAVDMLPIIQTKAPSHIALHAEGAELIHGHSKAINKGGIKGGVSYLDDFEGAKTPYDLTQSPRKWVLGSTPANFPESSSANLDYTYRRARLAWYIVDNVFYGSNSVNKPKNITTNALKNHFVRVVYPQEVFPNQNRYTIQINQTVLNYAYYPSERGPYNYNPKLDNSGNLYNPSQNWGAATHAVTTSDIDFDNANIQYIEFWMMSPYIHSANNYTDIEPGVPFDLNNKGTLYFNLGNVSEDVMKDGIHAFENGLPTQASQKHDSTMLTFDEWGAVTKETYLNNAFDNSPSARPFQDVGLDGLNSTDEATYFGKVFLDTLKAVSPSAYNNVISDPSGDDFHYYLGSDLDAQNATILQRYKRYNGMENNSPVNASAGVALKSNGNLPNNEDINLDNNVDNNEAYYEYKVDIDPSRFVIGENYIVDKQVVTNPKYTNGDTVTWYQFRIPIRTPNRKVGEIVGYKSIKFLRMFMTGFASPVVLRLTQFQFVANQWRIYGVAESGPGSMPAKPDPDNADPVVSTVNIEQNSYGDATHVGYTVPPGFYRDMDVTSQTPRQLNEQSLQLCVDKLGEGKTESVYKYVNYNLLNYKNVRMFLSANSLQNLRDSAVTAFLRIGTDFSQNYYEIDVPLFYTKAHPGTTTSEEVWRSENLIDVAIKDLVDVKVERNTKEGANINYKTPYSSVRNGRTIRVVGNPDLSTVITLMIGMTNPIGGTERGELQTCIWADELIVTGFVQKPGYAATASLNMQLADLATLQASARYTSAGFGALDQNVSERPLTNTVQYSVASNIALDKFLPRSVGLKLPFYVSSTNTTILPRYDPLNPDVPLMESIRSRPDSLRASYRAKVIDETVTNSWNFTNVRKVKTKPNAKSHFYDVENLGVTFGMTNQSRHNKNLHKYDMRNWKGALTYTFNSNAKIYEPFKKLRMLNSPYLKLIKDFNFSLLPSSITFSNNMQRKLITTVYYAGNPMYNILENPLYQKSFTFNRTYGMTWNFTRNLTADFNATSFGVFDEPNELTPGTKAYNDSLWTVMKKLGRKKNYSQTAGLNYKLPLSKIPLLNWLGADARYSANYNWIASALDLQDTLGNSIANKQSLNVNGRVNLDRLYGKLPFLQKINNPAPRRRMGPKPKPDPNDTTQKDTKPKPEFKALKAVLHGIMSLKMINATYTLNRGTSIAGYMKGVDYLGMASGQGTQMLPFVLGSQDPNIRTTLSSNGWMSRSLSLNTPFSQTKSENLNLRTSLQPVNGLRIQVDAMRNETSHYQELYRLDSSKTQFISAAPVLSGSYTISFISIGSAFMGRASPSDPNSSKAFALFESYRKTMQERRKLGNNYGVNSQEILIPAFIAAYSGRDPNKVKLSSFPRIPLPNWRIDYTGLSRIKSLAKVFSMFSISHSYQSSFTISSFTSSLSYGTVGSQVINSSTNFTKSVNPNNLQKSGGKYVSPYTINTVVISEKFSPLIGLNFRTKSKIEGTLQYTRSRTLSLSLANSQIQEINNNGVTIGIGYSKSGIKLPFASGGNPFTILKNTVKFRVNFSLRDGKTVQRQIDNATTVTAGNLNWQLRPTINYMVNQRVNLTFYFQRTVNAPKISSSFKRTTTDFGIQLLFTLS